MKKIAAIIIFFFLIGVFFSCNKKSSTISSSTSSTASVASPSVNTSVTVGAVPWNFNGCVIGPTLTATNGTTTAELVFGSSSPIPSGVYSITSGPPLAGQVRLKIIDPPGQPSGFIWYSSLGSQTISVATNSVGAITTFTNITCTQTSTSNPVVTASGTMACI